MNYYILILTVSSFTLSSCAISPRPEQVTFNDTRQIIHKIRCEIQEALYDRIIVELNDETYGDTTNAIGKFLDQNRHLIPELTDDGLPQELVEKDFWKAKFPTDILGAGKLNKTVVPEIAALTATGIAYRFRFQITEQNRKSGSLSLELPFPNFNFSTDVSAGKSLTRQTERIVTFSETFNSFGDIDCRDARFKTSIGNIIYPITGRVGMKEVIFTYIGLLSDIIAGGTTRGKRTFEALNDRLTFTTALSAGADPEIVLSPGGLGDLRVSEVELDFSSSRVDLHEVRFGITPPKFDKSTESTRANHKGKTLKASSLNGDRSVFRDRVGDEATAIKATRELNRELDVIRSRQLLEAIGET